MEALALARWQARNSSLVTTADELPADKKTLAMERQSFFSRLDNQLVKAILRSPLHGLVSGNIVLITVTGRKSGKAYTTPVRYWRQGDMLTIVSRWNRTWWRNVRGGSPVTLRLQGKEAKGWGMVTEDDQGVVTALAAYLQQVPRVPSVLE
jgi:deazaflavin-dependent oxidoreductase (nitroreductase family)